MPLKVTLMFNQYQSGWTESFYTDDSTLPGTLSSGWLNVAAKAIAFRAPDTELYAIRFSLVDGLRQSVIFYTGADYHSPITPSASNTPDPIQTTCEVNLFDGAFRRRSLLIRGLMDHDVTRTNHGNSYLNPGFEPAIRAYMNALIAVPVRLRSKRTPAQDAHAFTPVTSIVKNLAFPQWSNVKTINPPGAGIVAGAILRFKGNPARDLIGFPANPKVVTMVNVVDAVIEYNLQFDPYTPINVQVVALTYQYTPITTYEFIRFSKRDTGRPFGSLVGRRKKLTRRV